MEPASSYQRLELWDIGSPKVREPMVCKGWHKPLGLSVPGQRCWRIQGGGRTRWQRAMLPQERHTHLACHMFKVTSVYTWEQACCNWCICMKNSALLSLCLLYPPEIAWNGRTYKNISSDTYAASLVHGLPKNLTVLGQWARRRTTKGILIPTKGTLILKG